MMIIRAQEPSKKQLQSNSINSMIVLAACTRKWETLKRKQRTKGQNFEADAICPISNAPSRSLSQGMLVLTVLEIKWPPRFFVKRNVFGGFDVRELDKVDNSCALFAFVFSFFRAAV
jgi:hypothetical protein